MKKIKTKEVKNKLFQFTIMLIIALVVVLGVTELFNRAEKLSLTNKAKAVEVLDTSYQTAQVNVQRAYGVDNRTNMERFYDSFENDTNFRNYILEMNVNRNNPGNIRCANQPNSGCKGGFATFPTNLIGFRSLIKQIELDLSRGDTIETFVKDYAPKHDNNDTDGYTAFIARKLGKDKTTKLKDIDVLQLAVLVTEREHSVRY